MGGKARLSSLDDLREAGLLAPEAVPGLEPLARRYAIGLTQAVRATVGAAAPVCRDPVGRQYIPTPDELATRADETGDPTGDAAHTPVPGIVHRYPDRALLKLTGACAVYCRFCFRRERVGAHGHTLSEEELGLALDYLRTHPAIREVILTGGDPLVLSPAQLGAALDSLDSLAHLEIVRIHSRVPVAEPSRVTPELCRALDRKRAVYLCVHVNHANELTKEVGDACRALHAAGCVLLSQSVLLRGVNDSVEALEALLRRLTALRIKPYYLHHLDHAPGTGHFRVDLETGRALVRALRGLLTGIAQPLYVLDIPGGYGKIPIGPGFLEEAPHGGYILSDPWGGRHLYKEDEAP